MGSNDLNKKTTIWQGFVMAMSLIGLFIGVILVLGAICWIVVKSQC